MAKEMNTTLNDPFEVNSNTHLKKKKKREQSFFIFIFFFWVGRGRITANDTEFMPSIIVSSFLPAFLAPYGSLASLSDVNADPFGSE